jgi:hypothetical protein
VDNTQEMEAVLAQAGLGEWSPRLADRGFSVDTETTTRIIAVLNPRFTSRATRRARLPEGVEPDTSRAGRC